MVSSGSKEILLFYFNFSSTSVSEWAFVSFIWVSQFLYCQIYVLKYMCMCLYVCVHICVYICKTKKRRELCLSSFAYKSHSVLWHLSGSIAKWKKHKQKHSVKMAECQVAAIQPFWDRESRHWKITWKKRRRSRRFLRIEKGIENWEGTNKKIKKQQRNWRAGLQHREGNETVWTFSLAHGSGIVGKGA